ncbi:HNH endonuclease signature motif containing protein [Gordonia sp. LSe1-13]|uniref:HNH endonuclease signature motif containing protein n=1 Tax=Gordonia sesuvii TaxID=3116777 RepID=A0ABU7MBJ1_9ACTN|nr:HNH endonuclease signature motif containing protein [Gordonia sp. LSe1-13]
MFTYTDPAADDTLLSSVGAEGLGAFARDALRLSRQAEARALLMAYHIGESAYNERLFGADGRHRMIFGQTARNTAVGEISLALRINKTKAGEWYSLGASLQEYPKIRMAYLAGEFSTHRMSVMVHAADIAPKGDLRDQLPNPDTDTTDADDAADEPADPTLDDLLDDEADDTDPDAEVQPEPQPDQDGPVSFEDLALELGNRASTDTGLRDDLADAVISLDPDGAAESRDAIAEAFENITFSNEAGGHMNLDACMPAEHGVHLRDRITKLVAARVCKSDPRTLGRQRILAFGEIVGIPGATLTCECGEDTCTAGKTHTKRGKRTAPSTGGNASNQPHPETAETTDTTDRETDQSDGDDENGRSPSSASITAPTDTDPADTDPADTDPADAEPAASAETHDTADTADGSDNHEVTETGSEPAADIANVDGTDDEDTTETDADTTETDAGTADDTGTADDSTEQAALDPAPADLPTPPAWTLLYDPTGVEPTRLQGYGAIDPAHAERLAPKAKIITVPTLATPKPASRLIVVGERALAPPIDPSGHGGFDIPPPGALIYRPPDRMRAEITYLDRRCRYPYCSRPSHECELDHLVKFNHADPLAGGWSVPFNFAPLCRPDHHRKHDGGWVPTMHTDRTITWRNLRTGETIITYPR